MCTIIPKYFELSIEYWFICISFETGSIEYVDFQAICGLKNTNILWFVWSSYPSINILLPQYILEHKQLYYIILIMSSYYSCIVLNIRNIYNYDIIIIIYCVYVYWNIENMVNRNFI